MNRAELRSNLIRLIANITIQPFYCSNHVCSHILLNKHNHSNYPANECDLKFNYDLSIIDRYTNCETDNFCKAYLCENCNSLLTQKLLDAEMKLYEMSHLKKILDESLKPLQKSLDDIVPQFVDQYQKILAYAPGGIGANDAKTSFEITADSL